MNMTSPNNSNAKVDSVEERLTPEERENFRSALLVAREFRNRVGLELPDEEAGLSFAESWKFFGKISDLQTQLYEFFRLRREKFPHIPFLLPPAAAAVTEPAAPASPDRKFRIPEISDHKMSFETESRLWATGSSTGRLSEISCGGEKTRKRELQRLIGKMIAENSDFVEGVTPLTVSELLHALGNFKEEFPTISEADVIDYLNQDPAEDLRRNFRKFFGFPTSDPVLLFNFFCQHREKISMRGFSTDQILNALLVSDQQEIADHPQIPEQPVSGKAAGLRTETLERLARPREKIADLEIGNLIRKCLRAGKTKPVAQVYTEIVSTLDPNRKKIFLNLFSARSFQSEKTKFPIKKFPCVIRAVEVEVASEAVGEFLELRGGSEIIWRSEISSPGLMRVEHLAFVPAGPVRLIGNFKRVEYVEMVRSEIYSTNFQVLVEEERRRLTMTESASLRLSEISENFRLQSQVAKIRSLVKTRKFVEARTLLEGLRDRKFQSQEISDLQREIDHHFFLQKKIPKTSNFRSNLPVRNQNYSTKVVFGRTVRTEIFSSAGRAKSADPAPLPPSPESTARVIEEEVSEISSQKFPTVRRRFCVEWLRTGECSQGANCGLQHGNGDTEICRKFLDKMFWKLLNSDE